MNIEHINQTIFLSGIFLPLEEKMAIKFKGHTQHIVCDDEADIDSAWDMGSDIYVVNSNKHYKMCSGGVCMPLMGAPTQSILTGISVVTSTSGGGTQISATKYSSVNATIQDSITTSVGGTSTSTVIAEICATDSSTAGDWIETGRGGDSQTITLAIALQSAQPGYRQICLDLPAGWYFRLRETGVGTHSASFISGQKTIYG